LKIFGKYIEKIQVALKSDENNGHYAFGPKYINDLSEFFLICEMFRTNILERIKTGILCSVYIFFENLAVYEVI
jgi:GTPase Era involved in 16S rRNA processing